jgi:glycosyltransferase involved in cell wall biosynthesis
MPPKNKEFSVDLKVTTITAVLNTKEYLEECIQSVLSQGYSNIEHLFIDGGSTDGSIDILSKYCDEYPNRIRFISEPDKGGWDAVNKGILLSKGDILGFMGSDDTYEPDAIQTAVDYFKANKDAYLVFGICNYVNEKGEIMSRYRISDFNLKESINGRPMGAGPATFYKREIFNTVGLFDGSVALACDFDFAVRARKIYQVHRIEMALANFRFHKDSTTTGSWVSRKATAKDAYKVCRKHNGSFFSHWCMMYYAMVVLDWFRPILWFIYPLIGKITGKNMGKSKDDWEIRRA